MTLEFAVRLTEVFLALTWLQQSIEHLAGDREERFLFGLRAVLCVFLLGPWGGSIILLGLFVLSVFILKKFNGPYNGGSDRMGLLALFCLTLVSVLPSERMQEVAFGYLAVQLILSYFISGWVKIVNPDWRSGRALSEVFLFSVYPVSGDVRGLAMRPGLLFFASWCVIGFELLFPLSLLSEVSLAIALIMAAVFHLLNALFFGLNRFFWTWISVYPSIWWLQDRVF